jgi:FecR protein
MATIPAHVVSACISVLFLAATLPAQVTPEQTPPVQASPAQTTNEAAPSSGASKVRIVRLSEVKGEVQLDRDTGRGFEPAMTNLPIVEHNRLRTAMGVAEVEFEDNSTLRITPDSLVEFPQLERLPAGTTASSVHVIKGMAYVSLVKTQGNEFNLLFGQQKLQLPPSTHIRLHVDDSEAKLAVLDGTVRIDGPSGPTDVPKKKTVTFHLQDQAQPIQTKDVAAEAFDTWDKNASGYHAQSASLSAFGNSPYAYGVGDMMYYGSFMNVGGCGSMWRPYFTSAAWDPYSNGAWAWYQGAGYSWVSPYPWGWTPYHYGSWSYCSGAGWGWQPGGSWNGLNNTAALTSKGGAGQIPPHPIAPPRAGESTLTAVNLKPLIRSEVATSDSFVFRKDSAGLGIPRDTLGKLDKFSQHAVSHGMATTSIYISAPTSNDGRPSNAAAVPGSLHRGTASGADMHSQMGSLSNGGGSSAMSGPASASHSAPASGHAH